MNDARFLLTPYIIAREALMLCEPVPMWGTTMRGVAEGRIQCTSLTWSIDRFSSEVLCPLLRLDERAPSKDLSADAQHVLVVEYEGAWVGYTRNWDCQNDSWRVRFDVGP